MVHPIELITVLRHVGTYRIEDILLQPPKNCPLFFNSDDSHVEK